VVDSGLARLGTGKPGRDNPKEGPSAQFLILEHEGPAGVTLARVLTAILVARAEHVVKDFDLFERKKVLLILETNETNNESSY
jgi:hypothetical protein